jgi:hypothetical protein
MVAVSFFSMREIATPLKISVTEQRTDIKFCFTAEITSGDINPYPANVENKVSS